MGILRDYQEQIARQAAKLLKEKGMCYLAMEVRTGKTLTALTAAYLVKAENVLFVTKLMAISSIEKDFEMIKKPFKMTVINYESLHKVKKQTFDLVIADEAHSLGAFPKPSKRAAILWMKTGAARVIFLSGTPTPESYSQLFHQFSISGVYSPWSEYRNFYEWAKDYVYVTERIINGWLVKNYSKVKMHKIEPDIKPYLISFTQSQAGFNQEVIEFVRYVQMKPETYNKIKTLLSDQILLIGNEEVVIDTAAKKMSKVHQLFSGTVKTETGKQIILDDSKAVFIKNNYKGRKIGIYYNFIAEGDLLKATFKDWTNSPRIFNANTDTVFISQIQSGSMGVNLSTADIIIFYNISHSSLLYWQARARMQDKNRTTEAAAHWIFAKGGIEDKIYKAVQDKKDYTTYYFRKDYESVRIEVAGKMPEVPKAGIPEHIRGEARAWQQIGITGFKNEHRRLVRCSRVQERRS